MIGKRLRNLRELHGLTQTELSKATGISFKAISHYELNRRDVDSETAVKFAEFFGVSLDYLYGLSNSKTDFLSYEDANPKKSELMQIIDSTDLPDDKYDLIINLINSWK